MNNIKAKVGDEVVIKINSLYFTDKKRYKVEGCYTNTIVVTDDTNCEHSISHEKYEVVGQSNITSAYNLIGKNVEDGSMIHHITRIGICVKGMADESVKDYFSYRSEEAFKKLSSGEIMIVLHDNGDFNFPYDATKHVEFIQIKVKLNDKYTAIVSKDIITVGCQTFPTSILKELNEAYVRLSKSNSI